MTSIQVRLSLKKGITDVLVYALFSDGRGTMANFGDSAYRFQNIMPQHRTPVQVEYKIGSNTHSYRSPLQQCLFALYKLKVGSLRSKI